MSELELVTCIGCGGSGVVIDVGVVPNCVHECRGCRGEGRAPKVVTLTASADPRPYEPPKVYDLGTVEDLIKADRELEAVKDVLLAHDEDYGSDDERDPSGHLSPATCVKRLISERDVLKKQVDSLQADNTRLVEQRRAVDERYMVEHFHRVMGQPVLERPQVPADETVRLRLRLIAEESFELLKACVQEPEEVIEGIEYAEQLVDASINDSPIRVDLPEFTDACQDLKYVIVGAELEFGIDGRPVFAGVHAANMRKTGGPRRADGKIMKPEGWQPFDVANELRRQGWRGP